MLIVYNIPSKFVGPRNFSLKEDLGIGRYLFSTRLLSDNRVFHEIFRI